MRSGIVKRLSITFAAVAMLGLGACSNTGISKQTQGLLGGAALGGLVGSLIGNGTGQLVATGAGVLLGALIGSDIGRSLDDVDRMRANQAFNRVATVPINQTIRWNNPQSGNSGSFTPIRDGRTANGEYCREYQETVTIGGRTERAYGVACRQPDGSWKLN